MGRCTSPGRWRPPAAGPASSSRPLPAAPHGAALRAPGLAPDVVGLSLRNADNAAWPYTNTYTDWYARVADAVRAAAPRAQIVLGGPAFSIFPREIRRALLVAEGVVGDGEPAARRMAEGALLRGIAEELLDDLGGVGLPRDIGAVFPGARRYRTAGVQTARGCPHRCVYCTYPRLEGTRLRRRPPQAVADEMVRLRRTSARPSSSSSTRPSTPRRVT